MDNYIKLESILNDVDEDFAKNLTLYNDIYKFYNNKDLQIEEIDLLIITIEDKLSNKKVFIDTMNKFTYSIILGFSSTIITNIFIKYINADQIPNLNIGSFIVSFIGIFIGLIYLYFILLKPLLKNNQEDNSEKLVYTITLKILNDLRNNL